MGSGMSIDLLARTATLFSLANRLVKYRAEGRTGCVVGKKDFSPLFYTYDPKTGREIPSGEIPEKESGS